MTDDDHSRAAALARLTENEKDCLRRRLLPQTAKEIARDLRLSPHAVEKRFKMARAKLGVGSSLEAARLLAVHERYHRLVPDISDLSAASNPPHAPFHDDGGNRRIGPWILWGGIGMSILIIAAVAAALAGAHQGATPEQATAFLVSSFEIMDSDHSGYIEPVEAPGVSVRDSSDTVPRRVPGRQGAAMWIANYDRDGDGKVSKVEFIARMLPGVEAKGVPANWRPRH